MPRRKQGHSKESATGGCLKKKTDTGKELIQNETLKSFPTNNDLVFKIKKTVSSTISNTTQYEETEREHLAASKSLNDNVVSQYEVNNNSFKCMNEKDISETTKTEDKNVFHENQYSANENNENGNLVSSNCLTSTSSADISVKSNSFPVISQKSNGKIKNNFLAVSQEICDKAESQKSKVQPREDVSSVSVISTCTSGAIKSLSAVMEEEANQKVENSVATGTISDRLISGFCSSQMSGVKPVTTSRDELGNETESKQMNYRISTSVIESSYTKDISDHVIKDKQNCQLPSSVYGTSASNIEKVLTGLQVNEKSNDDDRVSSIGKISFLQEILEQKSAEIKASESLPGPPNSFNNNGTIQELKVISNLPSSKCLPIQSTDSLVPLKCSVPSNFFVQNDKNLTNSLKENKFKLHIPEYSSANDDSNSSILSLESQKSTKFPKITSPQILEQHISKIISQNAAIVETIDPVWSRRYLKQSSLTSPSVECESKKHSFSGKVNRSVEERVYFPSVLEGSTNSKLQSALLGGSEAHSMINSQKFSISQETSLSKERNFSQLSNLSTTVPSVSMYSKIVSVSDDELKGSAIKSLLSFKRGKYSKHKNAFCFDKDLYSQHPQNPEGSIIKDLLLKSKSKDGSNLNTDGEERLQTTFNSSDFTIDFSHSDKFNNSLFKCPHCFVELSDKYNLDIHMSFCKNSENSLSSLRETSDRFSFKQINAQSKPEFQYSSKMEVQDEISKSEGISDSDDGVGTILKKQLLLPLSKSPPMKRRKVSDSVLGATFITTEHCTENLNGKNNINRSIPSKLEISPHRSRSQSVHLFGGEVQILDGAKTKKIKIKTCIPGAFPSLSKFSDSYTLKKSSENLEVEKEANILPAVIVTIAQPVHNSGGTVHLPTQRSSFSMSPVVTIPGNISDGISKFGKLETTVYSDYLRIASQTEPVKLKEFSVQNLSYPSYAVFPGPDFKCVSPITSSPLALSSCIKSKDSIPGSVVDEISPVNIKASVSPNSKPFYSPIFSSTEKSLELPISSKEVKNNHIVPTVMFTPSSPTLTSSDNEITTANTSSISEPTKKFLAPTRPTSLPLKKKPFTMVGSTLISPETPRPKKSCIQLYLNGHAYTYLGLKCSTRSTYCCIYRSQPMFVLQETNPKLSMYSNWQVVPAKEELCGLTPGQMISFYCSKQRKEHQPITVMAKVGEPLIFTHSSYWTFRSQDHVEQPRTCKSFLNNSLDQKEDTEVSTEKFQELTTEAHLGKDIAISLPEKSEAQAHSADESSLRLDTDNTLSDGDVNNSNEEEEDDDDCQEDGTESLTDSSQPQPPKRVKIFEGGFKSNEDYTYVRGRGRGKYVCEECGIRCKKPSMLKKHIRTHTDLRPYKCRHCSFAFKTKGNLTKHMKSKAHHKKCTELGIVPVPTTTDDSQIDEEALAKQIEKKKTQFSDGEDADDDDDDDTEESEDECESDASSMIVSNQKSRMLTNGHSKKSQSQEKLCADNFDDNTRGNETVSQQSVEQEAARSLLHLSALGEPSQWSTSTGDLTDVTSPGDTETGSLVTRHERSLLSPQFPPQSPASVIFSTTRQKTGTDQWLSTEMLGHRPRSYSADIPMSGGKDLLAKYKLTKNVGSDATVKTSVEESSEFSGKEQYARRYSISVAREARKPQTLQPPAWSGSASGSLKWPDHETSDQPMDLSVSRDLGKYKPIYGTGMTGPLLNVVTQDEGVPDATLTTNLDTCLSEPYQLKSLPVLSPQVLIEYETGADNSNSETPLLPLTDEPASFGTSASRSIFYLQDIPSSDVATRKDTDASEDPPSPDISDYTACSPASPPALDENSYYYSQDNMGQGSAASEEVTPSSRFHAEFIVPSSSSSGMEEGKCVCRICNKIFAKSSHLRLHVNIHYFERPFRCDNCAVSFRTKGHLQKHKRSVSHYNKVNMNLTFGTPTVDNPRPFKCAECKIAFRIHGHLAKHLRSKMHIMKLECLGKLPFGMYAEMERSGISLNEIDTTDCNNSLKSLQVMAQKLYQRDPRRMRWQNSEQTVDADCSISAPPVINTLIDPMITISEPLTGTFDPSCTAIGILPTLSGSKSVSDVEDVKREPSETDALQMVSAYSDGECAISPLSRYVISQPVSGSTQNSVNRVEASQNDSAVSLHRSGTCHICGRLFKSAKFLQVHLYSDHTTWNTTSMNEVTPSSSSSSITDSQELICDLCGRQFSNQKALQQHLLSHAQPRPFVCEICDAGFTSSSSLIAHQSTHQNNS
ncbi:uncharacterized protein LOC118198146 isoform X2 [Stegodyphus dumicola]|uniref:uncharacterized protein LOC118198146 isoform X2 n=1 Tax=Stegodyphus dumicola TaxID=202533 RepID=UPI0015AC9F6E|nr:uncharacterized protein LOC118198146 isoform X2 [Stegodyphus dumicola]